MTVARLSVIDARTKGDFDSDRGRTACRARPETALTAWIKRIGEFGATSIGRRLLHASLWSLIGTASARLLTLLAMILAARELGQESFGKLGILQATVGVFGLFAGMGLGGAATRYVAQFARTSPDRAGRVIALVMAVSVGTTAIVSIGLIASSTALAQSMLGAGELQRSILASSILLVASTLRGVQSGILAGLERFRQIAWLNALDGALCVASVFPAARYLGIDGAIASLGLSAFAVWIIGQRILGLELSKRGIREAPCNCVNEWRIITGYSVPSFMSNVIATPVMWFGMVELARSSHGYAEVGIYSAANQWQGPLIFIPITLAGSSIPVLVQEWESGSRERFIGVARSLMLVALILISVPATVMVVAAKIIMGFYGSGFESGWAVLVAVMVAAPFHGVSKVAFGILSAMDRQWWIFSANLVWVGTFVYFAMPLITSWGALGLALTFLVAYIALAIISVSMIFFATWQGRQGT